MTTQDADGPELAQALDSLTDALSRAVRHAQQEESAFQMAPVELVLKVMVSWAEPGAGGAEWRVLGPGTTAAHSLTMRFTPREARRDSAGPAGGAGRAGESSGGSPSSDPRSRRRASSAPAGARLGGWRTVLPTATSLPATAVPSTAVPGAGPIGPVSGLAEGRRGPDWAGGSVPPVRHGGPYAVRVSVYLDEAAGERPRLLVERAAVPVPEQETAEFARAADQPGAGPQGRKPLVDAIGEYVADRVDRAAFKPVKQQWEIRGYWNPAAASDQLDGLQKWLLHLVQQPQEDTAAGLGVPSAAAEVAGGIGANIVIAPVNRAVEGLTKIVDIVGIVAGTTLGLHPIALLCLKHLVHTEFHDMVVKAVTKAFDGLVVGTKEVPPPSAGGPARHPSPPTPPPRPAPGPPPSAPPSPPPGRPPSAPPSPGPWRQGGSGIRGPGGF